MLSEHAIFVIYILFKKKLVSEDYLCETEKVVQVSNADSTLLALEDVISQTNVIHIIIQMFSTLLEKAKLDGIIARIVLIVT